VAYESVDRESGTRDIWVYDLTRRSGVRVTQHAADETCPIWAPDDRTLYFLSYRDQQTALYRRAVDGTAPEELVATFDRPVRPSSISPDGAYLFYEQLHQLNGWDLWMLPLGGGDRSPYLESPFHDHEAVASPDGRFVAYASPDSGGRRVYLAARDHADRRWPVSTDYGREPLWRPDGRELFFHGKDRMLMAAPVDLRGAVPKVSPPRPLFQLRFHGYDVRYHYAALPDGRRFILNAPIPGTTALPATVVLPR